MRQFRIYLLLPLLAGFAVCAAHTAQGAPLVPGPATPSAPQDGPQPSFSQEGLASWYGHAREGKPTANGEHFHQRALTGADRSLPFNTVVRVTDLETGKTVKVRINDRGPFAKGRIIDLSRAAAAALGMAKRQIDKVRVEVFAADQALRDLVTSACSTARHGLSLPGRCDAKSGLPKRRGLAAQKADGFATR